MSKITRAIRAIAELEACIGLAFGLAEQVDDHARK
jgi:biotin synthase-like enzyme